MADAPNTSSYILESPDTIDLPNSRTLVANGGIVLNDGGAGENITISTVGNLSVLNSLNTNGLVAYYSLGSPVFAGISLEGSSSINIVDGDAVSGNPTFSVINNSSIQQVNVEGAAGAGGTSTRSTLNFVGSDGISVTVGDNGGASRADITISGSGIIASTVTSIASANTNIVVSGSGSGPYTGAVTLTAPNWADVVPANNIQMNGQGFEYTGFLGFAADPDGHTLTLTATGGTTPVLNLGSSEGKTSIVYDSFFNFPGGNSGIPGQVLTLTSAPTGTDAGILNWTSVAGTGTVTNVSGSGLISVATGTSTPVNSITPGINGQVITTNSSGAVVWGAGGGGGGGVTSVTGTAPIVSSGGTTPAISLAASGVTAGSYSNANITVSAEGLITVASSGSGGGGGLIGATSGTGAAINIVGGNSTVPLAASGGGQVVISGQTPAWTTGNSGGNVVVGGNGSGLGNGTAPTYTFCTIIGSGAGTSLVGGENAINIGNATYGLPSQTSTILIGDSLFNGSGSIGSTSDDMVCIGSGYSLSASGDIGLSIFIGGGGGGENPPIALVPNGTGSVSQRIAIGYLVNPSVDNTGVIGSNVNSGTGGTASFKLGVGQNTPLGTLHLGNSTNTNDATSIFFDGNSNAHAPSYNSIPANGMAIWVGPTGLPFITATGAPANVQPTQIPMVNRPPTLPGGSVIQAGDMIVGSVNTTAFTVVNIDANPVGSVWKITNTGSSATCGWGATALAASEPIFAEVNPIAPVAASSYIALANPSDVNNPTDFELPVDYAIGSSFRVIGLNRYGWDITTSIGSGIPQKIVYNNQIVSADNTTTFCGIQCDPASSPAAEYLGTTVELVYAKLEADGTQVWVVIYTQGVIDLFES